MTDAIIDVVIPVWNRPNETRNCLVNLINHTPQARLIMYDCGSERETERLLQEFADGLEERALLMRDDSNIGFVRAANRGLERSEALYLAVVRSTTIVSDGWIEPLLDFAADHAEAGILLPCHTPAESECAEAIEVTQGSFAAMLIRRTLYQQIGGFDEGMDGGLWCLRDFTRRACAKGYLTYRVPGPPVEFKDEVPLGSERRRKETAQRSIALFRQRWGESGSYIIHIPKGVDTSLLKVKLDTLVKGARHDDLYQLLLPAALHKAALLEGMDSVHENIKLVPLPRLPGEFSKRRLFEKLIKDAPGATPVAGIDGIPFPWSPSYLTFADLTQRIMQGYDRCETSRPSASAAAGAGE